MKKLLALILAMVMALCCMAPALAETVEAVEAPAVTIATPVLFTDYETQLAAVYAAISPDAVITWQPLIGEESLIMVALLNGSTPCVYTQVSDGYIQQMAVELTAPLTEDSIMTFVALSTYATGALLALNGVDPAEATQLAMFDVYAMFEANLTGSTVDEIFGLPCAFNLIPASETTVTFYYMLDLASAEAAE